MWEDKERMKKGTEESLKNMPMARMKHFDKVFGLASFKEGKYLLIPDGEKEPIVFNTIDALSDAGWTID
jgi:hypothetical protein